MPAESDLMMRDYSESLSEIVKDSLVPSWGAVLMVKVCAVPKLFGIPGDVPVTDNFSLGDEVRIPVGRVAKEPTTKQALMAVVKQLEKRLFRLCACRKSPVASSGRFWISMQIFLSESAQVFSVGVYSNN